MDKKKRLVSAYDTRIKLSTVIAIVDDGAQTGRTEITIDQGISSEDDAIKQVHMFFSQFKAALEASISPK